MKQKSVRKIEFWKGDSSEPYLVTDVVYSSSLANDMLAMSLGEFYDEVRDVVLDSVIEDQSEYPSDKLRHNYDYIDKDTDDKFDKSISDIVDNVLIYQMSNSSESGSHKNYYTYVGNSKMTSIIVPAEVNRIKFYGETLNTDGTKTEELIYELTDVVSFHYNRILILIESNNKVSNISPIIHEASSNPHVLLDQFVLVTGRLLDELGKDLFDEKYRDVRNGIRLGVRTQKLEFRLPKIPSIRFPDNTIYYRSDDDNRGLSTWYDLLNKYIMHYGEMDYKLER